MGADSLASNDYNKLTLVQPKVFRLAADVLVGISGSIRAFNVLRYEVQAPPRAESETDDLRYVVGLANEVRDKMRSGNAVAMQDGLEDCESTILVGYRGRLFVINTDFCVMQPKLNYWAHGSGGEYALGSLYSTCNTKEPKKRITMALDAASAFSPSVAPPYVYDHI